MSSAALAKKRRANEPAPPPPMPTRPQPQETTKQPMTGLTLPQVIAVIDSRLTGLEKGKELFENRLNTLEKTTPEQSGVSSDLDELLQDFHERFELLATQIADLKDTLLKLQTYTMDVNKMLLEQRIAEEKSADI
jgi:uncharacterized coiled-coil protein SlyX